MGGDWHGEGETYGRTFMRVSRVPGLSGTMTIHSCVGAMAGNEVRRVVEELLRVICEESEESLTAVRERDMED